MTRFMKACLQIDGYLCMTYPGTAAYVEERDLAWWNLLTHFARSYLEHAPPNVSWPPCIELTHRIDLEWFTPYGMTPDVTQRLTRFAQTARRAFVLGRSLNFFLAYTPEQGKLTVRDEGYAARSAACQRACLIVLSNKARRAIQWKEVRLTIARMIVETRFDEEWDEVCRPGKL